MSEFNNFLNQIMHFDYIKFLSNIFSLLTFDSFLKLIAIYFFIVWIAIIIWVIKDIINRTNNILLQIFSILTVLFWTPLWIVIYLLIRPSKTLFEKYYEESTIEDYEEYWHILEAHEKISCPNCSYSIKKDYKYCPNCRTCLKKMCFSCEKELKPEWTICPYCWKDQEKKVDSILNLEENNQKKGRVKIKIDKKNKE